MKNEGCKNQDEEQRKGSKRRKMEREIEMEMEKDMKKKGRRKEQNKTGVFIKGTKRSKHFLVRKFLECSRSTFQ